MRQTLAIAAILAATLAGCAGSRRRDVIASLIASLIACLIACPIVRPIVRPGESRVRRDMEAGGL